MSHAAGLGLVLSLLLCSCTDFDALSRSYESDLSGGEVADLSATTDGPPLRDLALTGDMQPICNDGLIGAGETDIDCGGGCSPCDVSRACVSDVDCQTGFCDAGRCELVSGPPNWLPVGNLATNNNPPIARYDIAMATAPDGSVLVLGGRDGGGVLLNTVERLDENFNWTTGSMFRSRARFAATTTSDAVYAIDGAKGGSFENTVERSTNPPNNFSLTGGNIGQSISDHGAVSLADKVYVYGGNDGTDTLATASVFTNNMNASASIKSMNTPREHFGAARGVDGRIYAMGGINDSGSLATAEAYDLAADKWTNIAALPEARATAPAVAAPDGRIYMVGGADAQNGKMFKNAVAYRPPAPGRAERWSTVASMASPRWRHGAALGADGRIYVVGGADLITLPRLVEAYGPIVTTNTGTVAPGGNVTVSGSNFAKNTSVKFMLDSATSGVIGTGNTDGNGALAATTVTIPATATMKTTRLFAIDARSRYPVSIRLTISN